MPDLYHLKSQRSPPRSVSTLLALSIVISTACFSNLSVSSPQAPTTVDKTLIDTSPQAMPRMNYIPGQYAAYKQTLYAIKKGHKTKTRKGMEQLKDYPLYPYLEKEKLISELKKLPFANIDRFLIEHKNSLVSGQLVKKWLRVLAQKKRWEDFNRYFQANLSGDELNCLRLEALHQTGFGQQALQQTANLWLSDDSMPSACDAPFKRWEQAQRKTDTLVWQRTQLALNSGNRLLARYLSKRASAQLKPYTRRLISIHRNPRRLQKHEDFSDGSPYTRDIISHGLKRLAARDRLLAVQLWTNYRGYIQFSEDQHSQIRNKIARQIIASGEQDALDWLIVQDPNADDSYLLEWRIRLALKQQKWSEAKSWIALLPEDFRDKPRWRYWLARIYQEQSLPQADKLLRELAGERHFYGFLAAELSGLNYDFNHRSLRQSAGKLEHYISDDDALKRAYEFFNAGDLISARREWFFATNRFDREQLIAATELAHNWGWHQQAILTTMKANEWNDLNIRFPLAYKSSMMSSAVTATIRPEWLYAIARQESAFATDAYSSAGAKGLLQLRPKTAQKIAQKMGVNYAASDLYVADKNIALGSGYLKQLLNDFQGNHILATAAYNAGPHRVKKWIAKQSSALPVDIWIETLPYHETRDYVQNVLAFSVIYAHRLGRNASLTTLDEAIIGK